MSHSKFYKKGQSVYINNWNPSAKKYINVCYLCGKKGYNPNIKNQDFRKSPEGQAIYEELTNMFNSPLILDSFGRCEECAKIQNKL